MCIRDSLTKGIPRTTTASSVYLDPACGGGNFLSHILNQLFVLRYRELDNPIACIENIFNALYGYELDPNLAAVASVNLKLKALMLLAKVQQVSTVDWRLFCPNIFTSVEPNGFGFLEADFSTHRIRRVAVSYTHLRAHETRHDLVCRLLLEKKKKK